jgi:hypothetical protein
MTQYKVSELSGALLDAAVAKGFELNFTIDGHGTPSAWTFTDAGEWAPSTKWEQGGPIIETESLCIDRVAYSDGSLREWGAAVAVGSEYPDEWKRWYGPTPLIAAMRAWVASKFGETVELP